jgi:predicted transcriptional regulator YdeE
MFFEIVLLPAMMVMGAELRTTWVNNECYKDIPAFLERHRATNLIGQIPNKTYPDVVLNVYTNYAPDFSLTSGHYSLIHGCPVTDATVIPEGMVVKQIPAAKYAVFTAQGPFASAIIKVWMEIWQNKELQLQRTFTSDFEWYDAKSTDDENSIVKIYMAIK